jgi:hypothetical protein
MSVAIVTGSSGLIGSEAARFLDEGGLTVVGIDNNLRQYFLGEEGSTTWKKSSTSTNWTSAGANSATDRGTVVLGTLKPAAKGKITIVLNTAGIAVVQKWINNPSTNFGFIFQNYANGNRQLTFDSREASTVANRPKLTIQYAEPLPVLSVNAGSDQSIFLTGSADLYGAASYSNAALLPATASIQWTVVSGPAAVAIGDPASLDTTATFSDAGDYVLRLAIDDGVQSAFDEVSITVTSVI